MRVRAAILALCLVAAGRTPNAEVAARRDAEFQLLIGGAMADLTQRKGLTPNDMYPTSSGRTFVVSGPASTIAVPGSYGMPRIAAQRECCMLIDAVAANGKGLADNCAIESR